MARWEDEVMCTTTPGAGIKCATCKYRLKPITIGGYTADRYNYGSCEQYTTKPPEVLWENADCPHYEKDS